MGGSIQPMAFDLVVNPFAQYAIFHAGYFSPRRLDCQDRRSSNDADT
jgi:hypothetical protein